MIVHVFMRNTHLGAGYANKLEILVVFANQFARSKGERRKIYIATEFCNRIRSTGALLQDQIRK